MKNKLAISAEQTSGDQRFIADVVSHMNLGFTLASESLLRPSEFVSLNVTL